MKKQFLTCVFFFLTLISFAQSGYDIGFKAGYKAGYCYNDFGCIAPIPPITPIPYVGESGDSYQDGYNRGFKMGTENKQNKNQQTPNSTNENNSGRSRTNQGASNIIDYQTDFQQRLNILNMQIAEMDKDIALKKEKTTAAIRQIKDYYNSLSVYPEYISSGWHKVLVTNNFDLCSDRKVLVEDNKVIKYSNAIGLNKPITFSSNISKGKSIVQIDNVYLDIYFLENINSPDAVTSAPISPGRICFWTNFKKAGTIKVFVDGQYVGKIENYFEDGYPNCGQDGTLTITYVPGIHSFTAESEGGWSTRNWEGTFSITSDNCNMHCFTK